MKKILFVDDDATIREIYRVKFQNAGYAVETAEDGLAATSRLRAEKPDLVVLDLMMPKLSGVDVLKFIRTQPQLESTPVVLFTNSFMGDLAEAANGIGFQRAINKAQCTPDTLVNAVNEIFAGMQQSAATAGPGTEPPMGGASSASSKQTEVRQHFLDHAPATLATLRTHYQDFARGTDLAKRAMCLDALYRKVHFVTALAGLAGCHHIALHCGAFEALLFELQARPTQIDPSAMNTIAVSVDFLEVLFENAATDSSDKPLPARVLIVDDDPLSNHLASAALHRAHLTPRATEDPLMGMELLQRTVYDLVLLDIEMPHMTGFDLCRKLRSFPGYARTPVIYVTAHSDFESRARSVISGGNDLIAKPIFPIELAVKAVTHLVKSRLPATSAGQ